MTVLARPGAGLGARARLSGAPVGTITGHNVSSADPAYGGKTLASVLTAAVLVVRPNHAARACSFRLRSGPKRRNQSTRVLAGLGGFA